jgi:hypothetical protein
MKMGETPHAKPTTFMPTIINRESICEKAWSRGGRIHADGMKTNCHNEGVIDHKARPWRSSCAAGTRYGRLSGAAKGSEMIPAVDASRTNGPCFFYLNRKRLFQ